ncbi:MAG: beta-ketoacyl-ACP synthase II [Dehalococcoidales bacterium]|nr:beta-ketoacyl-ACP synthase II [Dehalococcoidales bacterium]
MHRVVITGLGAVTPLGHDIDSTWTNLISGVSGIGKITSFDPSFTKVSVAAEVKDFDPVDYIDEKTAMHTDRFAQFAIVAASEALDDSGLDASEYDDISVILGCGMGGLSTMLEQTQELFDTDRMSAFSVPMMINDSAASAVSIYYGLKGPNFAVTSACSSSNDAIGISYELIRSGSSDVILTGGADAVVNELGIAAFDASRALSHGTDKTASSPFDSKRDGFVIGEGSVILILEELDHAVARGAKIYAEILSYGATSDAYHVTKLTENAEGLQKAIRKALDRAGLKCADIDYINAHGTSTKLNDINETKAYKEVFGESIKDIPVSSTKSMTGHMIGASGAMEAAVCIKTIVTGMIPPTINLTSPDPECDLDYVPNMARRTDVRNALSSSMGFGGHNSVLLIGRYDG